MRAASLCSEIQIQSIGVAAMYASDEILMRSALSSSVTGVQKGLTLIMLLILSTDCIQNSSKCRVGSEATWHPCERRLQLQPHCWRSAGSTARSPASMAHASPAHRALCRSTQAPAQGWTMLTAYLPGMHMLTN